MLIFCFGRKSSFCFLKCYAKIKLSPFEVCSKYFNRNLKNKIWNCHVSCYNRSNYRVHYIYILKKGVRYVCDKEEKDMIKTDQVKINVKKSIEESLDEVEKIQNDQLPKRSYKHMLNRVREKLNEEKK